MLLISLEWQGLIFEDLREYKVLKNNLADPYTVKEGS